MGAPAPRGWFIPHPPCLAVGVTVHSAMQLSARPLARQCAHQATRPSVGVRRVQSRFQRIYHDQAFVGLPRHTQVANCGIALETGVWCRCVSLRSAVQCLFVMLADTNARMGRHRRPGARAASTRLACDPAPGAMPACGGDDTVDLRSELPALLRRAVVLAGPRGCRLEFALQPGLVAARTDPRVFRDAMHDVMAYAIGQAASRVLVTARQDGGRVRIVVADDGDGQVHAGRALRLHAAQEVLEPLGGTARVESRPGQGSRVIIGLPGAPDPGSDPAQHTQHAVGDATAAPWG